MKKLINKWNKLGKKTKIIIGAVVAIGIIGNMGDEEAAETAAPEKAEAAAVEQVEQEDQAAKEAEAAAKAEEEAAAKAAEEKAAKEAAEEAAKEDQQMKEYREFIVEHSGNMGPVLGEFGELFGRADIYSDDWIMDAAINFNKIIIFSDEALNYENVPAEANKVHDYYTQAMKKYKQVAEELPAALDAFDAEEIEALALVMQEANELVNKATEEIYNMGA